LTEYIEKRDFIRDTFGRYVTKEVVQRLLESEEALALGGETREVTILMSDLRGFTALTADMTPEGIISLLNRYLEKMIAVLVDYRAVIDEIQGDGILAFFGAPEALPDHTACAVACAVAMQTAMEEVNAVNAAEGLPHLEMGIGVGSGAVVVGNIGSELRTKYSVVGSPVNFTSRIEGMAGAGQVLISADTYKQVQGLVETGEVLSARMKGIPDTVTLYEVLGLGAPYNLKLKKRQDTLVPLPLRLPLHLDRIRDKVVVSTLTTAWLTHLSETGAVALFQGELAEWEDVRLHLLDPGGQIIPGRIYGKVTALEPGEGDLRQATVRFTSVGPEIHQQIHELIGQA
jgi:class 3 adenylate cyclase